MPPNFSSFKLSSLPIVMSRTDARNGIIEICQRLTKFDAREFEYLCFKTLIFHSSR